MPDQPTPPPRLPNVGEYVRGCGTLAEIRIDQPPPPPPIRYYIFDDVGARTELRLQGEVIKEVQTLTDFYGLETSVKTSIEEAQEYAKAKGIGPESDLEVVVLRIVSKRAQKVGAGDEGHLYDRTFKRFVDVVPMFSGPRLPQPVATLVWSSKTPVHNGGNTSRQF